MTETLMNSSTQNIQTKTLNIGSHEVKIETGRLAKSAQGACTVHCGETVVMATACGSEEPRPGIDFFPLLVDYEERMFAVGRIPGGFIKREGRPSEKAVLTCRLIDRPIRPLWPEGYRKDVQVVTAPWSLDSVHQPDVLAILAASAALTLSGLPFEGPIGAVRIGRIDGQFIINPTFEESENSDLDLVVSGTADSIMMVEAGATFVNEADLLAAIDLAHQEIKVQVQAQLDLAQQCGVVKQEFVPEVDLKPLTDFITPIVESDISAAYREFDRDKRKEMLKATKEKLDGAIEALPEDNEIKKFIAEQPLNYKGEIFKKTEKRIMRSMVLNEGTRADGRKPEEIRPITCEVGFLPRVHGSGIFTRGNTQVLSILTLGSPGDAQDLDGVDPLKEKRWIHHYNFPGFSVGEVKPNRGASRREIGHGALAERAIAASLPEKEQFPYTVRVNSEVLESNGSTSMASTCATSLAMMDGGVPVKTPISGIAMGLIKEGDQYVVLSDIQGLEDFLGDMDFKVTGDDKGVTALQMDIKIRGISVEIMRIALEQARQGRLHILDKMTEAIQGPRTEMSPHAPQIITLRIDKEAIGALIGPGGKTIRSIIDETGVSIDVEDDGLVTITCVGAESGNKARDMVERLTMKIEPGMVLPGKVVRIIPVGAFVELSPGKDGMVHISQLVPQRVNKVEDVLSVGDEVVVLVTEIDDRGRTNLSIKEVPDSEWEKHGREKLVFDPPEGYEFQGPPSRPPRRDGPGGRPPRRDGGGGGGRY